MWLRFRRTPFQVHDADFAYLLADQFLSPEFYDGAFVFFYYLYRQSQLARRVQTNERFMVQRLPKRNESPANH